MAASEVAEREDLTEQIDACNQKKSYIQDQITEAQGQIVALDENKVGCWLYSGESGQANDMRDSKKQTKWHRTHGKGLDSKRATSEGERLADGQ